MVKKASSLLGLENRKLRAILPMCTNNWWKGMTRRLYWTLTTDRIKGSGHKFKKYETASEQRKPHFYCEGGQTLDQAVQRSCRVFICGCNQHPTRHNLGTCTVVDSSWAGSWIRRKEMKVSYNLNDSVILTWGSLLWWPVLLATWLKLWCVLVLCPVVSSNITQANFAFSSTSTVSCLISCCKYTSPSGRDVVLSLSG